jgi:ATP-dependent Clp protease protease subunit
LVLQPVQVWSSTPLDEVLLQRRIIAVTGPLDAQRATDTAARLLYFDADATGDITIRLDCDHADVAAALMLVDTFGSLRAKVHVVVVGQAVGAAAVVVAAADSASIYPHARVALVEPELPTVQGDAAHLDAQLAEQRRLLAAAYDVIARRCGRAVDDVERDARRRRLLTAVDAVDYGLVDRIE